MPSIQTIPEADEQAQAADAWWVRHRPSSPNLFLDELTGAIDLLQRAPDVGRPHPHRAIPGLRRLLLTFTRHHIYYVHDEAADEVIILAVWGASRAGGPRLRLP